jgi:hypothetical protein
VGLLTGRGVPAWVAGAIGTRADGAEAARLTGTYR